MCTFCLFGKKLIQSCFSICFFLFFQIVGFDCRTLYLDNHLVLHTFLKLNGPSILFKYFFKRSQRFVEPDIKIINYLCIEKSPIEKKVLSLVASAAFDPTKFNECAAHGTNIACWDVLLIRACNPLYAWHIWHLVIGLPTIAYNFLNLYLNL